MSATENKRIIEHVYAEMAKGNTKPFAEAMADDMRWVMMGTTAWSGTYDGKEDIMKRLIAPLRAQWAVQYTAAASRVVAEGDVVVAEVLGNVQTRAGKLYNNRYCLVFRMAGGKVKELTEYMDTDLVNRVLDAPAR
jgi:uncharacterized protein